MDRVQLIYSNVCSAFDDLSAPWALQTAVYGVLFLLFLLVLESIVHYETYLDAIPMPVSTWTKRSARRQVLMSFLSRPVRRLLALGSRARSMGEVSRQCVRGLA